jgi:hypothetical protein
MTEALPHDLAAGTGGRPAVSNHWEYITDGYDERESEFCECGVTLMGDPDEDDGLCGVCAGAPHGRECGCDACEAYWHRICEESRRAADEYNRRREVRER